MDIGTSSAHLVQNQKKPSYMMQYFAAFSATMGALSFGCALGYSSPAGPMLMANATEPGDISLSEDQNSWFGSTINIGALTGGLLGGLLISNLGRKLTMMLSVIIFVGGWLLTIFAQNFGMLVASRILLGLCTGVTCISAPTYIGELSSVDIRGTLGSAFQLMVVIGIEYAYIFGAIIDTWQILAVVCAIPPVIFLALLFFAKESPVYLLSKGKEKEAKEALQYFRGKDYDVQGELDDIQRGLDEDKRNKTSMKNLFNSYLIKPLMISLGLMFFQQFSGVNAVLFNLTSIFESAGTSMSDDLSVILVGLVQIVGTVISSFLIDRLGRKILLIASSSVMSISLMALGVYFYENENDNADSLGWLPLVSLMLFIFSFSIGYGPIPWIMMNELFPRAVSEPAASLSTVMNWSMSFVCTLIFVPLKKTINDSGVYWFFAILCAVNLAFCILIVPETKGKTLEEITAYFGGPTSSSKDTPKEYQEMKKDISTIS